jgi:Fe2+ transport system protein FeoA
MRARRRRRQPAGPSTIASARPHHRVRVVRVTGGRRLVQRLAALGIVPGAAITVDRNRGPALISVGHTRVAIGRQAAEAVEIEADQ